MINIYALKNAVNFKMYVGQTGRSIETRLIEHKSHPRNRHLKNAMVKYGKDNFTIHLLDVVPNERAEQAEDEWMRYFDTRNSAFGYNVIVANKSRLGVPLSDEHKAKLSAARKGRFTGSENPMFGKRASPELRKRLSDVHSGARHHYFGKHRSLDDCAKISNSLKGLRPSDETRAKISATHTAHPTQAKINLAIAEQIRILYKTGTCSHREIAEQFGIKKSQVGNIINNVSWRMPCSPA